MSTIHLGNVNNPRQASLTIQTLWVPNFNKHVNKPASKVHLRAFRLWDALKRIKRGNKTSTKEIIFKVTHVQI